MRTLLLFLLMSGSYVVAQNNVVPGCHVPVMENGEAVQYTPCSENGVYRGYRGCNLNCLVNRGGAVCRNASANGEWVHAGADRTRQAIRYRSALAGEDGLQLQFVGYECYDSGPCSCAGNPQICFQGDETSGTVRVPENVLNNCTG